MYQQMKIRTLPLPIALGLPVIFLFSLASCSSNIPEGWEPRVVKGEKLIKSSTFYKNPKLGIIADIREVEFRSKPVGKRIVIVGEKGAVFLDRSGNTQESISFSIKGGRIVPVDINYDGTWEYVNRGGGWQPVSLYDNKGQILWSYEPSDSPNDMAVGDIDEDGKLDFVVGCNGGGGIQLLDQEGNVKWRQKDSNVWHVEMLDINGDGKLEIVHSNAKGLIKYRDVNGNVIGSINTLKYFSYFSLCKWPTIEGSSHFLVSFDEKIWLLDMDGKVNIQLDAPWAVDNYAAGTLVRFDKHADPFFAVMVEVRATWKRSILYIYDSSKKLIYQEILPVATASVYTLSSDSSGRDTLLVAGEGVVWQYELNEKSAKTAQ